MGAARVLSPVVVVAAVALAGCASVPRDAGFADVERIASERTGSRVHWNRAPKGYDQDPGWYEPPPGTLAALAPAEVLRHNGIAADGSGAPRPPAGVNRAPPQAEPTRGHAPGGAKGGHGNHAAPGGHGGHGGSAPDASK